ncbi:GIY-YIG nuclease family protein [Rhodococcus wratislaviensis]|uniref:GIY-YIG nuclease family protein n=1 Tax=Rhodococcus wratislaviensis TaxID=44752 RepID=UPI0039088923
MEIPSPRTSNRDAAITDLSASLHEVGDLHAQLPAKPGLYAWWADADVLAEFPGSPHPHAIGYRLLYVGIASNLRRRILHNHLRRSGSSTLRRTLAGLLMARKGYQTRRTDRVVLTDSDETRLTAWMDTHLRLSWSEHPNPRQGEQAIIEKLTPPLNVDHTKGPYATRSRQRATPTMRALQSPDPQSHNRIRTRTLVKLPLHFAAHRCVDGPHEPGVPGRRASGHRWWPRSVRTAWCRSRCRSIRPLLKASGR